MKFSYTAVWNDVVAMLRANGSLLLAIAGVFFLLPALLTGYLLPQPEQAASGEAQLARMMEYYTANIGWLLLGNLVNMVGVIAIYLLLFDARGRTVGGAIAGALPILPFYLLMSILVGLAVGVGLVLLVLPGIYLMGRLVAAGPAMVAEGRHNPLDAIRGSWAKTRGKGWAVAGMVLIVAISGLLLSMVATVVLGSVFYLIGGREGVGPLLVLILNSAVGALFSTVLYVLFAAIYRALRSPEPSTTGI